MAESTPETVHLAPPIGSGTMPCCGKTPWEVPTGDRMTVHEDLATCSRGSNARVDTLCEVAAKLEDLRLGRTMNGDGSNAMLTRCVNVDVDWSDVPEHPDWIAHVSTDPSWEQWRRDEPGRFAALAGTSG